MFPKIANIIGKMDPATIAPSIPRIIQKISHLSAKAKSSKIPTEFNFFFSSFSSSSLSFLASGISSIVASLKCFPLLSNFEEIFCLVMHFYTPKGTLMSPKKVPNPRESAQGSDLAPFLEIGVT